MKRGMQNISLSKGTATFLVLIPMFASAQAQKSSSSYFSNPLFLTLLVAIVLLLAFIAVIGNALRNLAGSDYLAEKVKKENDTGINGLGLFLLFLLISQESFSRNAPPADAWKIGGLSYFTFFGMLFVIVCEIAVIAVLFNSMRGLLVSNEKKKVIALKPKEKTLMDKLNASVEIEKEEEIMLTHNYDGIKELDNNLPPWWKYGFYLTILFSVVYLVHYHISKTGDLQNEEFKKEVTRADAEIAEFLKNSANNVDETSVKLLTDPSDLAAGKDIFSGMCATCHGKQGEGNNIGPNLTDAYWLHGGSLPDIFKTIKYGWPDKGMQSWKDSYSPMQIAQLTSFIRSLKGSNPPNAKEKQGDLYLEAASDTSGLKADSLNIVPPLDSLEKSVVEKK